MRILPLPPRRANFRQLLPAWVGAHPLLLNSLYILGVNLSPGLAGLVYWALASRWFLPQEIGLAGSTINLVILLAGFGGLGFGYGLLRFLPGAEQPPRLLNSVFAFCGLLATGAGLVFLAGARWWFPELSYLDGGVYLRTVFLLFVVSACLGGLVRDACLALRQARYAWRYILLVALLRPLLLLPFIASGSAGLLASSALAYALALLAGAWVYLPAVQPGYRPALCLARADLARLLPFSLGNYLVGLLSQLSQALLPLLVLRQLGTAASGCAYLALVVAGLAAAPGLALSTSALVEIVNSPAKAQAILRQAAGLGVLVSLVAAGPLFLLAPWLLALFGPPYAAGAGPLLRLLALSVPLVVLAQFYFTYLRFRKETGRLVLLAGLFAAVSLGAARVWLPVLGVAAIGWSSLLAGTLVGGAALVRLAGLRLRA